MMSSLCYILGSVFFWDHLFLRLLDDEQISRIAYLNVGHVYFYIHITIRRFALAKI